MQAAEMIARARALDAEARRHKREERRHRNAARRARETLAEVESECARLGIALTLHPGAGDPPWPKHPSSTSTR